MPAFDRRSAILEYLQVHGRASTSELSQQFGVSEVTIRTDLAALQGSGWLDRRHGGAEVAPRTEAAPRTALAVPTVGEQPFDQRRALHGPEKAEIARAAAAMVQPGDHILLDGSTTAYHLALQLRGLQDVTVITNNLRVAQVLAENPGLEVLLIGGVLRGGTWSTVGVLAEEMLAKLHARQGFFGAAGFTLDRGFTDADTREVQVKRALVAAAGRVNVLLDSTKLGQQALLTFAQLSQVHCVVTDRGLAPDYADAMRRAGVELIVV